MFGNDYAATARLIAASWPDVKEPDWQELIDSVRRSIPDLSPDVADQFAKVLDTDSIVAQSRIWFELAKDSVPSDAQFLGTKSAMLAQAMSSLSAEERERLSASRPPLPVPDDLDDLVDHVVSELRDSCDPEICRSPMPPALQAELDVIVTAGLIEMYPSLTEDQRREILSRVHRQFPGSD